MAQFFIASAAISGALAVSFGAFGAHALDSYSLDVFQTAVQYHFIHSLALLGVGILLLQNSELGLLRSSGWLFLLGMLLFSGSLYVLSLSGLRWLGAIAPLGGLSFIAAWGCLAAASWKLAA